MKKSITTTLLILTAAVITQAQITVPLSWNDFTPTNVSSSAPAHQARVHTTIHYGFVPNTLRKFRISVTSTITIGKSQSPVSEDFMANASPEEKSMRLHHEKGRVMIGYIYYKRFMDLITMHHYTTSLQKETDSLLAVANNEAAAVMAAYDKQTANGTNKEQKTWDKKLEKLLEEHYPANKDFAQPDVTDLHYDQKLRFTDQSVFSQNVADTVFSYDFSKEAFSVNHGGINCTKEDPMNPGTDSVVLFTAGKLNYDFELSLTFYLAGPTKNYEDIAALYWNADSVRVHDYIFFAPSLMSFYSYRSGKKERDRIYTHGRRDPGIHKITVRKIADKYYVFYDDRFDEKLDFVYKGGEDVSVYTRSPKLRFRSLSLSKL